MYDGRNKKVLYVPAEQNRRGSGTTMTEMRSIGSRKLLLALMMTWIPALLSFPLHTAGRTRIRTTVPAAYSRLFDGRRRKNRRLSDAGTTLEWETFEFGDSPKWDPRFDPSPTAGASTEEELDRFVEAEAVQDKIAAQKMKQQQSAWQQLSPQVIDHATQVLLPLINDDRIGKIEAVLKQRTQHTRFLFENPVNPSNVWACFRTIESFGIQHVDVVVQSGRYRGKAALSQKRGMRTAMGSAQWLSVANHGSTVSAIKKLREEQNCRIYASDLNPNSKDIRTIDWNAAEHAHQPICIVMGNENDGISEEMRELVDETFTLPMCGFAESFNLSVATAITLAHLSAASKGDKGPLRPGDLHEHEYNCLFLKGLLNSLPQKRMAVALMRKEGIELPT
jgi:tRNA (guanosine-2'-O-)-methyltransferase